MAFNSVILTGRLTADPETKKAGDYQVAKFTVAVDRGFGKDKKVDFISCEAWGKTAEFMGQYLRKGDMVAVSGSLKQDTWEKDGKKQSRLIVNSDRVESLGGGRKNAVKDDNLDGGAIDLSEIPF